MKRILKKAGILLLVFLLGTAGTALLLNSESTDNRSDFNDAVFPEVMVDMRYADKPDVWICAAYAGGFYQRQCDSSGYIKKTDI